MTSFGVGETTNVKWYGIDPSANPEMQALRDLLLGPASISPPVNHRFEFVAGESWDKSDAAQVVYDTQTKMCIKDYGGAEGAHQHAELQFDFMNLLATRLAEQGGAVRAVHHPLLVHRPNGHAVAVMEPASGVSAASILRELSLRGASDDSLTSYKGEIRKLVRQECAQAVGFIATRLLVDDIDRPYNHFTNIFVDGEGKNRVLTLIDQPRTYSRLAHKALKAAQSKSSKKY